MDLSEPSELTVELFSEDYVEEFYEAHLEATQKKLDEGMKAILVEIRAILAEIRAILAEIRAMCSATFCRQQNIPGGPGIVVQIVESQLRHK